MKADISDRRSTRAIFLDAVDVADDAQRRSFLERACGNDPLQRQEIDRLLAMHDENAASPLDRAVEQFQLPEAADAELGNVDPSRLTKIDRYQLREQIGEGGMGIVYVAEQTEPLRRKVALKLIKPGMDSTEVINRFEAERQALALLDHPHVARVLDAGTTEQGRPYFVMELIRGIPITEYCDEARLDTRARLELFLKVCQGVQHAHLKGIIHRDLKPSNVLVTLHDGVPVPKVIDFGVAKALNQRLTEQTIYTQFRQMIGTPAYMSPEQAEMTSQDVDTRSDVYSLGVLLYELLSGTTPFDKETLRSMGFDEMRKTIREQEPPRPSHRLSTLGAAARSTLQVRRGIDTRQLTQILKRELDWIVMKALEKNRNRRYESASALADDLQRYLNDEPVEACPPATMYRLQKYARRHKALLTTTTLVALTAVIGTGVSLRYARQSSLSADQATRLAKQATTAQAVAERHASEAERAILRSRTLLYAADMKLASDAITNEDIPRAAGLLERHVPAEGQPDLRSFEWYFYWKRISVPPVAELTLGRWVDDLAISPDGRWLAATAPGGRIDVYETTNWQQHRTLDCDVEGVDCLAWSRDGRRLAAGGDQGTVTVLDFASGDVLRTFQAHQGYTADVAFAPEEDVLYSCGDDLVVRQWSIHSDEPTLEFTGHEEPIDALAVSPDGRLLATGSADRSFAVWDTATGRLLHRHVTDGSGGRVTSVAFSPDGRFVAAANIYGELHLAEARSDQSVLLTTLPDGIESLAFFDEGRWLATADRGGGLQLHHVPDSLTTQAEAATEPPLRWVGHKGRALSLDVTESGQLATGGRDGAIRIWTPDSKASRWMLPSMRYTPDRKSGWADVAIGGDHRMFLCENEITVWDLVARRPAAEFLSLKASGSLIANCSRDGRSLAAGRPGLLALIDIPSRQVVREWPIATDPHGGTLAVSPDGAFVAFAERDDTGQVALYRRHGPPEPLIYPISQCHALAFSPRHNLLAAGVGVSNTVRLIDLEGEASPRDLAGHSDSIADLAFNREGNLLASVGDDRLLNLWNVATGELLYSIVAHRGRATSVDFSPDGKTIATGGTDQRVRLWHTATGQPLGALPTENHPIAKIRFTSDGRRLVACLFADGAKHVAIYDAATRQETAAHKASGG